MIVNGFKCTKCFSNVFVEYYTFRQDNGRIPSSDSDELKRADKCRCGNCALILDLDGIVHVYCDDISTLLLCRVDTAEPSDAEILQSSSAWYYQDYRSISSTELVFTKTKQQIKSEEKKAKKKGLSTLQKSYRLSNNRNKNEKSKT